MTCTPEMTPGAGMPDEGPKEAHDWDHDFSMYGLMARSRDAYVHDAEIRAKDIVAAREAARVLSAHEIADEAGALALRKIADEQARQQ